MDFAQSIQKLATLGPEIKPRTTGDVAPPPKFSLDHIRVLLHQLADPQARFASVLVAGTNGKGSTSATLASIINAAGVRVGLYTSPHLLRVNERIRTGINGVFAEMSDDEFAAAFTEVDGKAEFLVQEGLLPQYPSFFELLTAVAFTHFASAGVELAVLEVGLGGRLDATNSVEPIVSVITDIGFDHMEYLGHTLREIAGEKAGILRQDGVLVTLSQHPEANSAIGEIALVKNVRGVDASRFLPPHGFAGAPGMAHGSPLGRNEYDVAVDDQVLHLSSPLAGQHQQRNLALAVGAAVELRTNHGFAISNEAIERGVRETVWPGRLEWIPSQHGHAPLLLDVAHNPAGAWTLRAALAQLPEETPRTLIFSCLADKQIAEMAQILLPLFDSSSGDPLRTHDHVVLAPIQNPRAATVEQLLAAAHQLGVPAHAAPHLPGALVQAEAITSREGIIVATGSVFLVGELRLLALREGHVA